MAVDDYVLRHALANTTADPTAFSNDEIDIELAIRDGVGPGVISGGTFSAPSGLNVTGIANSKFILGVELVMVASRTISLYASTTNRVWAVPDPADSNGERVAYFVSNTAGVADPSYGALCAEIVTGGSTVTTINNDPPGRHDYVDPATLGNWIGSSVVIDLTSITALTLSAEQGSSMFVKFTGNPGAACTVTFPNRNARFWVIENATTGGFAITVKPSGGNNFVLSQGRVKVVSDGSTFLTINDPSVLRYNQVSKTAAYTATDQDDIVEGDGTGAAFNVTLPAASGRKGKVIRVIKIDASGNAVSVVATGGDTILGGTVALSTQGATKAFYSNGGTSWRPIP